MLKYFFLLPVLIVGQIEKQVRDDNPALFKNHRIFHAPPKPLFRGRPHTLTFITDIPSDSVESSFLFFKTDQQDSYQEFNLKGEHGKYVFLYEPKQYPGERLQYYFLIKTPRGSHANPINEKGELDFWDKLLIDPVEYFRQKARLNQ